MRFDLHAGSPASTPCDLLAIVVGDDFAEDAAVRVLDAHLEGLVRQSVSDERFEGKPGQSLVIHTHGKLPFRRLALVGAGAREELEAAELRHAYAGAARIAGRVGARTLGLVFAHAPRIDAALQLAAEGVLLAGYRFERYRADEQRQPFAVDTVRFVNVADGELSASVERARIVASAVSHARDLVNEAPGVLTPARLAEEALAVAKRHNLEAKVLGPDDCQDLGMGMLLAVGRGSEESVRFLHIIYRPEKPTRRIGLIGKGLTFDSGGLSLKPTDGMQHMKMDMAGAAVVLATIGALAELRAPVEVHAIAPCAENMVSGRSYRLGDVLRSMSGKTVEVMNTDAEGRLALADALVYAQRLELDELVDFATLTGACVVALGPGIAGVMSNRPAVRDLWIAASRVAGEEMWPLPLPRQLRKHLDSDVADLKNVGKREGGALTAGLFLQEFVDKDTPWVHVDLAGPAWSDEDRGALTKGGTGFGVAAAIEYIIGR